MIVNSSEESNSIQALDKEAGKIVWRHESPNLEGSAVSPVVVGEADEQVLIVGLGGAIWGMAPGSGELIWEVETGTRGGIVPTPITDGKFLYTFGGDGESFALRYERDLEEGSSRVVWKGENQGIPSPILHEGLLILVRTTGIAACISSEDGAKVFSGRLQGRTSSVYASPVVADDRLYVVSRERGTFVYSADSKLELLARNELEDDSQFNASPALVGDEMFLRSDKFLYCLANL